MHTNTESKRRRRRLHTDEFKAQVVAACQQPGISMASVALAHGINANLLRRWVVESEAQPTRAVQKSEADVLDKTTPAFVPLALPSTAREESIRIELRRGDISMTVTWPLSAATDCAHWMREWLR